MIHGYAAANLLASASLTYRDSSDVTQIPTTTGQFPLGNLSDTRPGRVFKWRSVELANIRAVFVSPVPAAMIAVVNHNWAADSAHILEYSADGTSWFTATTFTPDRTRYFKVFPTQTAGFWRVRATSWGSQAATPYAGEIWLGTLVTLSKTYAFGLAKGLTGITAGTKTAYGQEERVFKSSFESAEGPMGPALSTSQLAEMNTMVTAVNYSGSRFLFVFDTTIPTCWIARLGIDEFRPSAPFTDIWDGYPLTINEQPFGAPVA